MASEAVANGLHGEPAGTAGRIAGSRPAADPVRPDAGLALCLLPRRRAADGQRSRSDTGVGADRAGMRRRARPVAADQPAPVGWPPQLLQRRQHRPGDRIGADRVRERPGAGPVARAQLVLGGITDRGQQARSFFQAPLHQGPGLIGAARALRFEATVHNTKELRCRRGMDNFPEIITRLAAMAERFATVLDCADISFIADGLRDDRGGQGGHPARIRPGPCGRGPGLGWRAARIGSGGVPRCGWLRSPGSGRPGQ